MPTFQAQEVAQFDPIIIPFSDDVTVTISDVSVAMFEEVRDLVNFIQAADIGEASEALAEIFKRGEIEGLENTDDIRAAIDGLPFATFLAMASFVAQSITDQLKGKDTRPTAALKNPSRKSSRPSRGNGRKRK